MVVEPSILASMCEMRSKFISQCFIYYSQYLLHSGLSVRQSTYDSPILLFCLEQKKPTTHTTQTKTFNCMSLGSASTIEPAVTYPHSSPKKPSAEETLQSTHEPD